MEIDWVKDNAESTIGSQWMNVLILAIIVFPLIIKKKIQELKIAGASLFMGVICFIFLLILLRILNQSSIGYGPIATSDFYHFTFDKAFLSSLSTAFVAYGFQSAFFPIYNNLQEKGYKQGMRFSILGIGF
mmetsp:Transcript_31367/g.27713  ORF Transcript_31367/g.27713 Transcript_31367/m.27713 type:complete len:131 (+) Transcript_31367:383-775(+)